MSEVLVVLAGPGVVPRGPWRLTERAVASAPVRDRAASRPVEALA